LFGAGLRIRIIRMNERIQAMAASHFPRDGEGNIHATPEIIGEFAELIVKECCQKLENDGMVEVAMEIKEHFGIKP